MKFSDDTMQNLFDSCLDEFADYSYAKEEGLGGDLTDEQLGESFQRAADLFIAYVENKCREK